MTSRLIETSAVSSFVDDLTVLVLTYNEEANIGRTLDALTWAKHILIVDSASSDRTLEIIARSPQAIVLKRPFDSFARQCNFGLENVTTSWVLSLDADYEITSELKAEIQALAPLPETAAFETNFIYCIFGYALRGSLYPSRCVLYRRGSVVYRDVGHGHRAMIEGCVEKLAGKIRHDDRKPLSRWLSSQQKYASLEAAYLLTKPPASLRWSDRIRLMAWPAPILVFGYTLFAKRCLFDGWPGWLYVLQRVLAEIMIALEIIDRRLRSRESN